MLYGKTVLCVVLSLLTTGVFSSITEPNFADGRTVIVHLFEWKWTDIAEECERFLGPHKFAGVQVSPPSEHLVFADNPYSEYDYPWWERYQPIGYQLISRSGTPEEFADMVTRCLAVDVRIYVDAVINHMAGGGYVFPKVPFDEGDFNVKLGLCPTEDGGIHDVNDTVQMRYCNLLALADIHYGELNNYYGRDKVVEYLNKMIDMGVAGFRIDAAKHMYPAELDDVANRLHDCTFGGRPYIYQEVIDRFSNEAIKPSEYFETGDVTEFKFCDQMALLGRASVPADRFQNFGFDPSWGMMPSESAIIFVENHDNQRNHGGGGDILSFQEPREYKIGIAFGLAWNYGTARIFSGYVFEHSDQGPPSDTSGNTNNVVINAEGMCDGGWICEHRWREIRNMVCFRNVAGDEPVENWWDNGDNFIAFSRGDKAFFALNNERIRQSETLQTGLPPGTYCNLITGEPTATGCSGSSVVVNEDGYAYVDLLPSTDERDAMVALTIAATSGRSDYTGCVVEAAAVQLKFNLLLIAITVLVQLIY
ncbi:alpha-amylase B-like [Lytechinus variegatus]|uniref:alpha-amylase B-like n=1 Tax=Lytechinus variegatus TaxID=7654 RepID=UPI001BB199E7|nr:alpha-amylase B-like [Lytechinus variegatus]